MKYKIILHTVIDNKGDRGKAIFHEGTNRDVIERLLQGLIRAAHAIGYPFPADITDVVDVGEAIGHVEVFERKGEGWHTSVSLEVSDNLFAGGE